MEALKVLSQGLKGEFWDPGFDQNMVQDLEKWKIIILTENRIWCVIFLPKKLYILAANGKSNRRTFSGVSYEANYRMTLVMIIETVK